MQAIRCVLLLLFLSFVGFAKPIHASAKTKTKDTIRMGVQTTRTMNKPYERVLMKSISKLIPITIAMEDALLATEGLRRTTPGDAQRNPEEFMAKMMAAAKKKTPTPSLTTYSLVGPDTMREFASQLKFEGEDLAFTQAEQLYDRTLLQKRFDEAKARTSLLLEERKLDPVLVTLNRIFPTLSYHFLLLDGPDWSPTSKILKAGMVQLLTAIESALDAADRIKIQQDKAMELLAPLFTELELSDGRDRARQLILGHQDVDGMIFDTSELLR